MRKFIIYYRVDVHGGSGITDHITHESNLYPNIREIQNAIDTTLKAKLVGNEFTVGITCIQELAVTDFYNATR